ncbi:MAG: type I-E CRISPR-associated protein Cas5/CasD [Bryobacteraceae bacterium]|nr:type I-E CRISPR-associated protein Cas5/CasD [Bryobacteraceae bacterium]
MATLLIQLSGPLQAWGGSARFNLRPTQQIPTKSAVLGLVGAALGFPRRDSNALGELNAMHFGVRVEQPGELVIDFHTVSGAVNAAGKEPQSTTITDRHYLAGATFLAGLEGERALLERIHGALLRPRWLLTLGRRSCLPGASPWLPDGLVELPLEEALRNFRRLRPDNAPLLLELEDAVEGSLRMDSPIDFQGRLFAPRFVRSTVIEETSCSTLESSSPSTT